MIDKFNHRVTASERRGMIVLSVLILIITGIMCMYESGMFYDPIEIAETPSDTVVILKSESKKVIKEKTNRRGKTNSDKSKSKSKNKNKKTVKPRSPLDETIS